MVEDAASDSGSDYDGEVAPGRGKLGRAEKKARKAMQKLGMKVRSVGRGAGTPRAPAGGCPLWPELSRGTGGGPGSDGGWSGSRPCPAPPSQVVPEVSRVMIRKNKNIIFTIADPDVFKSPASDTYVIFGEAKIEDVNAMFQQEAARQMAAAKEQAQLSAGTQGEAKAAAAEEEDDGEVDETGLDPKDIDLIMSQAGVSRSKAVKALKKTDGDLVSAIMELTM